MEFRTYVNITKKNYHVEEIKRWLIEELDKTLIQEGINREKICCIKEAISKSGGSSLASRYGLKEQITFADSELINAWQRGKGAVAYLEYRYDFKYYPGKKIVSDFPLVVAVEASSKCNLRCDMCFQSNMDLQEHPQNQGIMSYEVYEKFLEEIEKHKLYSIVFASRGEPLLNPRIDQMISEAKKRGVLDIKMNTNATLLTEEMGRRLLQSGLDMIVFSVDSVNPENYHEIRGGRLDRVLQNINTFLRIRKEEFPDSKMVVRVAMVITKKMDHCAEEEVEQAKKYWLEKVDELSIKSENDFKEVYKKIGDIEKKEACSLLWERVYLWQNGQINPCDIDHLSSLCVGNIMEGDSICDIWKGEKMNELRERQRTQKKDIDYICRHCIGY